MATVKRSIRQDGGAKSRKSCLFFLTGGRHWKHVRWRRCLDAGKSALHLQGHLLGGPRSVKIACVGDGSRPGLVEVAVLKPQQVSKVKSL